MKTANFPRGTIEGVRGFSFPFPVGEDDWLISITDSNGDDAKPEMNFAKVLFMHFNDTTKVGKGEITKHQALEIATFIKEARALQKNIWVNCHAGICRSGAVVSLLVDLGWEYANSTYSPGRIPNCLVYDEVRKHFPELKQSWDRQELIVPEVEIISGNDPRIWTPAKDWK